MKKKLFSILMIAVFLVSTVLIVAPSQAIELPDYIGLDGNNPLAGEVYMPTIVDSGLSSSSLQSVESFASTPPVGTTVWDWYLSAISDGEYPTMTLKALSGNVEIWVQDYLLFPEGDPRNDDPYNLAISDGMTQYLADEFNNVIYPTDTTYFGAPEDRDGTNTIFEQIGWPSWTYDWIATDNPQRVILKVLNIRDENFYDPTYPYYTVGFYSSTYTRDYYKRNMIHIDAWRWWQRLGSEGTQWFPERPDLSVTRPYVYESTTAHEYQHNIHRDWNADSPSFMNEGCSMYAEVLCGYGVSWSHVNSYLYTPDNSLTVWGDQGDINILADYGAATLWAIYLSDHYGGPDFIRYYVQNGVPGIEGINAALKKFHYKKAPGHWMTFDDVYHDWRIANLIHTDDPGEGKYNYVSIDLGGPEVIQASTYDIKKPFVSPRTGTSFGSTITILGYDTGVYKIGAYGSDYIKFSNLKETHAPILTFDGDDLAGVGWIRTPDTVWYSTMSGALEDISIIGTFDLPAAPVTLTFDTYFDIEPLWDFGFVQVSTDGATWISLENPDTTYEYDPSALPDIIANLPGFTGLSDGWVVESFDLSAYAGMSVMLRFRYMTDWAVQYPGWWVDNIAINGVNVEDAFEPIPPLPEADFMVTICAVDSAGIVFATMDMTLDDITESGTEALAPFIVKHGYVLLIISPNQGPADYIFSVTKG